MLYICGFKNSKTPIVFGGKPRGNLILQNCFFSCAMKIETSHFVSHFETNHRRGIVKTMTGKRKWLTLKWCACSWWGKGSILHLTMENTVSIYLQDIVSPLTSVHIFIHLGNKRKVAPEGTQVYLQCSEATTYIYKYYCWEVVAFLHPLDICLISIISSHWTSVWMVIRKQRLFGY